MRRPWALDYDTANCTIGATVQIIGEKWTFLVLREAFNGVRRFDDMQRRTRAPRQILSDRLARLVSEGVTLTHRDCGAPAHLELVCDRGHVLESARDVTPLPGPGARKIA